MPERGSVGLGSWIWPAVLLLAIAEVADGGSFRPGERCGAELPERAPQGALLRGTAAPDTRLTVGGRHLRIGPQGQWVFGVGRDQRSPLTVLIAAGDGCRGAWRIAIEQRRYQVQRVDGLPPATVNPDPATQARIARENALITEARSRDSARLDWRADFLWPAQGRISGVYGSQRILNGEPRRPHFGLDIAAPVGTAVRAPAGGVVTLVHEDMVLTGKTVVLDHGHGVSSIFIHLSRIDVELGQTLSAGAPIGAIGATGRASGPHLHWGVYWFDLPVDPQRLLPTRFPVP